MMPDTHSILKKWCKISSTDNREYIITIQHYKYPYHDDHGHKWIAVYDYCTDFTGNFDSALVATAINYLSQDSYRKGFLSFTDRVPFDILEWAINKAYTLLNFS